MQRPKKQNLVNRNKEIDFEPARLNFQETPGHPRGRGSVSGIESDLETKGDV